MGRHSRPTAVVRAFVECINAHDVDGIVSLLSPDHRFIDSLGTVFEGAVTLRTGWTGYFRLVPDYTIEPERVLIVGNEVLVLGHARGTYSADGVLRADDAWRAPAAWLARVENGQIAEWRVYADNEPIRQRMRRRDQGLGTRD